MAKRVGCCVGNCLYIAYTIIDLYEEDFRVCELHDHPATYRILEKGEYPCYFWHRDTPVVLPCGKLKNKHFKPGPGIMSCLEDTKAFENVPEIIDTRTHHKYNLTV